jgi:glycosyltransferase involved in cell wall biosynthesis
MFPTHDSEALASIIAEVANNGEEARRRATSAKEIVSRIFSWKETARAYFSLFEEVAHLEKTMGVSDVYSERR